MFISSLYISVWVMVCIQQNKNAIIKNTVDHRSDICSTNVALKGHETINHFPGNKG